jgi:hypothetical protein
VKILFASAVSVFLTSVAFSQTPYPNQESGDIFGDIVRINQLNSSALISSPFNMGFVEAATNPIMSATFQTDNAGTQGSPSYYPQSFSGFEYVEGVQSQSEIYLIFTSAQRGLYMYATDYIPCIEAKIPKGTYTFQATATPTTDTGATDGTFMFETCTAGVWTVQFNLALPKPEGATRTLTFAHDTKVRWLLINNPGQTANAAITAKYFNSGS